MLTQSLYDSEVRMSWDVFDPTQTQMMKDFFFASVGMLLDLSVIGQQMGALALVVLASSIVKMANSSIAGQEAQGGLLAPTGAAPVRRCPATCSRRSRCGRSSASVCSATGSGDGSSCSTWRTPERSPEESPPPPLSM